MTRTSFRKIALTAFATLALGASLATTSSAQAHGFGHFGWGGVGFGVGALAATAAVAAANSGCYYQDREFVDRYGRIHVRTVEICR
ncbi:MAG: hypothetical protein P4L76_08365 [Beijerinckiaceae bacterium]|nr:hypothetical protein [Beijerinckiaceae bacterium]